ncbi:MAG: YggS family pyridoxal phosphate-dependent enzyme [Cyclobacteriaceae bacterium]|nr:YggS family pyridoxal phosphate-dependent enzyme [Cyclobacteriaceae bacterium]
MSLENNINNFNEIVSETNAKLVAVSKTKPEALIQEAYDLGVRVFGENKAQELARKHENLPKDIEWHMIGHLQSNKVKYIAPFVSLIHAVDSLKLLKEINKQALKQSRTINCLLQIYIADEETKFGLSPEELQPLIQSEELKILENIKIVGLMGMATNTSNLDKIRLEFRSLKQLFDKLAASDLPTNVIMQELSMGMSGDYQIAIEEGSTLIRVGSAIFGERNYTT